MNGTLHESQVLRVDTRHSHKVRVLKGTAYVTMEGDKADYFLDQGQELKVGAHHLMVVQGWPEAEVEIN